MNLFALAPTPSSAPASAGSGSPVEDPDTAQGGLLDFASLLQSHIDSSPATARKNKPGPDPKEPTDAALLDKTLPSKLQTADTPEPLLHGLTAPKNAPEEAQDLSHDLLDSPELKNVAPNARTPADGLMAASAPPAQPSLAGRGDTAAIASKGEKPTATGRLPGLTGAALRTNPLRSDTGLDAQHQARATAATAAPEVEAFALAATAPATPSAGLWNPTGEGAATTDVANGPSGTEALLGPAQTAPSRIATAATAAASASAQAHIDTPTHDPNFSNALAARVSMLAKDGVQKATLRLHPAEMGPVQVQIVIEGGRAVVSFSAAQSATCDLLESSMSELAAAMGEAGLDFGGGDVSQQAQSDDATPAQPALAGASGPTGAGQAEPAAPEQRPRGMLDLFA